jgi:hypothetical protein
MCPIRSDAVTLLTGLKLPSVLWCQVQSVELITRFSDSSYPIALECLRDERAAPGRCNHYLTTIATLRVFGIYASFQSPLSTPLVVPPPPDHPSLEASTGLIP